MVLLHDVVQILDLRTLMGVSRSLFIALSAVKLAPLLSMVTESGEPF
jgi:hypothetical protein